MNPAAICSVFFARARLATLIAELSVPQLKAVMKSGGIKLKTSASVISPSRRRAQWGQQAIGAIERGNDSLAAELLQQFLLHHRRPLLIDYLDALGVKHTAGETDQSFLSETLAERARECAAGLLARHDPAETAAYLSYIAFQQRSSVFDGWEPLQRLAAAPASPALTDPTGSAPVANGG